MQRLSSNYTLVLKVFFPTFWFVFFGLLGVALAISSPGSAGMIGTPLFLLSYFSFFLLFSALIYFTFIQLKRVDYDMDGIYVSNYFKTYKYSFDSILETKENDYWLFKTVNFILHQPGRFGNQIRFIPSKIHYQHFKSIHNLPEAENEN